MMATTLCDNCGGAPIKVDGRCGRCATHWQRHGRERPVKDPARCECDDVTPAVCKVRLRSGTRTFDYFLCPACVEAEQYIEAVRL